MTGRVARLGACVAALSWPAAAPAYWTGAGAGSGQGAVAVMPAGAQPSASVSGQTVTVTWSQSFLQGLPIGGYAGGGYRVTRYAQGAVTGVTPNAACDATVTGAGPSVQCAEQGVPFGAWQYTVAPVLGTFTGAEGLRSAVATVAPPAPALASVTARNPGTGQTTGAIELSWGAVAGATGYDVYRRTASGAYDFASPLNGATPIAATAYSDPGSGLAGSTTYDYVVRAVAGSPAVEGASSNELGAAAIARPPAPAGAVTATAQAAGRIAVAWSSVPGAAGYNLYRRTAAGAYDFGAPINGATPAASTAFSDTTATDGTAYRYVVRAVITGAGGAQVESADSAESAAATADATPPPAPLAVSVTSGGNLLGGASCGFAAGTRFVNGAGQAAVGISVTIAAPETGETVALSATSPGSGTATTSVAAGGTTVTATMNLSGLLDGTVTLTARTADAAGNQSAATAPGNAVVKDTVAAVLGGLSYTDNLLTAADTIGGTSECGATINATETVGANVGKTFPTGGATFTVGAGGSFSGFVVDAVSGTLVGKPYGYDVTATDLAGNRSAAVSITGSDRV